MTDLEKNQEDMALIVEPNEASKDEVDVDFEKKVEGGFRSPFNPPLYIQRYSKVKDHLSQVIPMVKSLADFGCAEGGFIRYLKSIPHVEKIFAVDLDAFCIEESAFKARPVAYDHIFGRQVGLDIHLLKGNITKPDSRLIGLDAITCIELVEHLYPDVLEQFVDNIFGYYKPRLVYITTPNRDYNLAFGRMNRKFRHPDHKFEWTRQEFHDWCSKVISSYPEYSFETTGVGDPPPEHSTAGFSSQIAIFTRINQPSKNISTEEILSYEEMHHFHYDQKDQVIRKPDPETDCFDWDYGEQVSGRNEEGHGDREEK